MEIKHCTFYSFKINSLLHMPHNGLVHFQLTLHPQLALTLKKWVF